jgi:hypothetical protein
MTTLEYSRASLSIIDWLKAWNGFSEPKGELSMIEELSAGLGVF